jgi:hypothetical protein
MKTLKEIDNVAKKWQETKEKRYKDEWYKLIKKFRHENSSNSFTKRSWTGRDRTSEES